MIHIQYNESKLTEFYNFIEQEFKPRVRAAYNDPYVTGYLKQLLGWLSHGNNLKTFICCPPEKLYKRIEFMEKLFPEFLTYKNANKSIKGQIKAGNNAYSIIHNLFIVNGYKKLKGEIIVDAVEADVCPYCNRSWIRNVVTKRNKHVRGQLDHFYDKDTYPYLALCKYNLIPSCPTCNGVSGKWTKDAYAENMLNPYIISKDSDVVRIRIHPHNIKCLTLKRCAEGIDVVIQDNNNQYAKKNIDIFNLDFLYATHKDYAAEIYLRSRLKTPKPYRMYIKKKLQGRNTTLSDSDINRIILGNYTEAKDFNKQPLAKMTHDIAKQLGII